MRSAVWSIARAARPAGARSALRVNTPPAFGALHTSAPRREEAKAVAAPAEEAPSVFSHWSVQGGVGFLLAIPLVQTQMVILSEETQLVGVFSIFVALAYQGSSEYLSTLFDERKKTVRCDPPPPAAAFPPACGRAPSHLLLSLPVSCARPPPTLFSSCALSHTLPLPRARSRLAASRACARALARARVQVMAEHNALEQAAIDNVKEVIEAHKKRLTLLEDMAVVKDTYQGVIDDMQSSATFEYQHAKRAEIVKMLDLVAGKTAALAAETQAGLVDEAAASVVASFASDAKAKAATLDAAIAAVGDPSKGAAAGKPVDALFAAFFKGKAAEMKKVEGKPMALSDAEKAAAVDEIAAILKRDGIAAGEVPKADELLAKVTY